MGRTKHLLIEEDWEREAEREELFLREMEQFMKLEMAENQPLVEGEETKIVIKTQNDEKSSIDDLFGVSSGGNGEMPECTRQCHSGDRCRRNKE